MKKIITAIIFSFLFGECFSQAGMWAWMKGDSLYNQAGTFGTQGIPSPTNNPPGFYEPVEWQDQQGNFWIFGGFNAGVHDDVWKFDPVTNEWTWMKGSGAVTQSPVYGTQGVASVLNTPGNQQWCAATWVDTSGNFWLFGGSDGGGSNYNLLWKYNPSTNEWTWMKGSTTCCQTSVFGTAGVPDPANIPGSRWETSATWVDANGDLWLFGGIVAGSSNELWRYSISTNMWTWMAPTNPPPVGQAYSKWKDENGDFWMFGGSGSSSYENDLWKYVVSSNQWIFIKGSPNLNDTGSYNLFCDPDTISIPSSRVESRACWKDNQNNFWLFGGYRNGDTFNDLWVYCLSTNMWTWVKGSPLADQPAVFGTQGIPDINNVPSSRMGSVGWKDTAGNLWMYSGWAGAGNASNDLWRFTIETTCAACPVNTGIGEINPANEFFVFPNPANSSFTVSFQSPGKQSIGLRIYNTLGKQVYFLEEETGSGKFEKEINTEKMGCGIYFLQVKTGNEIISRKVVIER